jgi:selenocysteine lyase/cysteine desulfurase
MRIVQAIQAHREAETMTPTRRQFLRQSAALPMCWATFTAAIAAAKTVQASAGDRSGDVLWPLVRRQFPLEDGLIYLNAANVCPASRPVLDRYAALLRDFHANPSFQNRDKYRALRESGRAKVAALLGVSADEIAITRNTSEGTNLIVRGLELKSGDEVVITDHNHPSNNESWKLRARREGLVVKSVPVPFPARSAADLVAGIEKAITPRTRVIAVTHLTSLTGVRYPIRPIAELARPRDIFLHVDGAQTFGALDVKLRDLGCDSYSASAHKWPMGPLEAGILFVRSERIKPLWPAIVSAGWSNGLEGSRKFEVLGQQDDPRVASLEAAIDLLSLIGIREVEARISALASHAKHALAELPRVELRTNLEPELSGGVAKFRLKGMPTARAYDLLWERHRLAIAMTPGGDTEGLRISPHVYNTFDEIDRAVAAVRELAG